MPRSTLFRPGLSFLLFLLFLTPALADEFPPDLQLTELQTHLAKDPADIHKLIELGDLQRFMGYRTEGHAALQRAADLLKALPEEDRKEYAGSYYLARAWMEYDRGDWTLSMELAELAVKYGPGSESWLIRALAAASANYRRGVHDRFLSPELKRAYKPLRTSFSQGPANGTRNRSWVWLVRMHFSRLLDRYTFERTIVGYWKPPYNWGEMECRRDWGVYFEDKEMWEQARQMFIWSAERSPVSDGNWATKHESHTPGQVPSDPPLPFWTNADGGYVTGSPIGYSYFACDRMMLACDAEERERWANNLADGASRCLAVMTNGPMPWLWRGFADLLRGDPIHAAHDIAQAKAEFGYMEMEEPLYAFVRGHELLMQDRYFKAVPWFELATEGMPQYALCWSELGLARVHCQRYPEAIEAFNQALEIQPDLVSARYNRGLVLLQSGRPVEAKADLILALEGDPGNVQIMTQIQRAHVLARDSAYQAAGALNP